MDCSLPDSSVRGDSPGKSNGVGFHALLQGIFPTQGSNPGLLYCRRILYQLSYQSRPMLLTEAYFCLNVLLVESVFISLCVMRQRLMTVRMWQNRKPSTLSFDSFTQISLPTQPRLSQLLCQFHKWIRPVSSGESKIPPTPHCHFGSPIFPYFIPHTISSPENHAAPFSFFFIPVNCTVISCSRWRSKSLPYVHSSHSTHPA